MLLTIVVASGTDCADISCPQPFSSPLLVSRAGRMTFASSHSKSHSIEASTSRSKASGCPFGDSRSPVVPSSSGGAAPDDSEAVEALAMMRSCFNIDLNMTTHRLVKVRKHYYIPLEYELHVPLLGQCPYNAFSNDFNLSTITLEAGLRFPLHPVIEVCLEGWQISPSQMAPNSWRYLGEQRVDDSINDQRVRPIGVAVSTAEKRHGNDMGASLRKRSKRAALEEPANASGSTIEAPTKKGRESVSNGKEPMEVEEVPECGGALHPVLAKQLYECSFEELMNRVAKSVVWARDDRVRLEGDVLSLTKVTTFLEAKLKAEGPKVVATYKASRGFESSLEKMGRITYEFGYRVALERLRAKHLEAEVEQDLFNECHEDGNVKNDLCRSVDDGTPSKK
ncbi:hypothetical protein B296_00004625 [Ensete ventricosum]|uniref:Uncharacterized protein n=1 Tax=Ensete ventricosum TaxID=4639 RepID=A0A427B9E8_ENSVE|nr:hypothetical protein B296_00004625 [Ensete ventricosum]